MFQGWYTKRRKGEKIRNKIDVILLKEAKTKDFWRVQNKRNNVCFDRIFRFVSTLGEISNENDMKTFLSKDTFFIKGLKI